MRKSTIYIDQKKKHMDADTTKKIKRVAACYVCTTLFEKCCVGLWSCIFCIICCPCVSCSLVFSEDQTKGAHEQDKRLYTRVPQNTQMSRDIEIDF